MPNKNPAPTEEQKLQKNISAMGDSVWLINKLIDENNHVQNVHDTIDRNIRHLELMIAKPEIANSGTDLSSFNAAINSGKAFIAVGITTS